MSILYTDETCYTMSEKHQIILFFFLPYICHENNDNDVPNVTWNVLFNLLYNILFMEWNE